MEKSIQAYNEIFKVLNKYKDYHNFDINEMERTSKLHLLGLELTEKYGLNIKPGNISNLEWNRFGEYKAIGMFGENYRRTISWSDDGKQPDDEMLLYISFPTGAYIFGQDYPTELFQRFFNELKIFNPKYCDTTNKSLYFSMDNAKAVFNSFDDILSKYHELNREDYKQRKIKKMKEELDKLENS